MARSEPIAEDSLPDMRARRRPGTAIAAMMPMIATTISSSMRVKPLVSRIFIVRNSLVGPGLFVGNRRTRYAALLSNRGAKLHRQRRQTTNHCNQGAYESPDKLVIPRWLPRLTTRVTILRQRMSVPCGGAIPPPPGASSKVVLLHVIAKRAEAHAQKFRGLHLDAAGALQG